MNENEYNRTFILSIIEILKFESPYNDPDSMFVSNNGSARIGYNNAIHKLEKMVDNYG